VKVLGIDPGSRLTGYAIVERRGSRISAVSYGTIRLGTGEMGQRLRRLFNELEVIVSRHRPAAVAIEGIFSARNASSALKLGHARGVVLLVASLHDIEIHEYAPRAVKQAVTSSGRAAKEQVQKMVRMILGLSELPETDAADALAVAICHVQTVNALRRGAATK